MANLEEKKAVIDEIVSKIKDSKSVVFVDYKGLTVSEDTALRNEYRKSGVSYKVLKNRLVIKAFAEVGVKGLDEMLQGPTAVAFAKDETSGAKIAKESGDKLKKTQIKGGVMDGEVLSADKVRALASIPAKEVLIAQLLGMLTMPIRNLAVVLDQAAKK